MQSIITKFLLLAVVLLGSSAYANCMTEAETADEMHTCLTAELQQENIRMQEVLHEVYDTSSHLLREVRQSQRDWENYRDSHCNAVQKRYNKGDMGVISHSLCLLDVTQLRIGELEILISH